MNLLHEFFNSRSDAATPLLAEDQERLESEFKAFQDNFYKIEKLEDITDPESQFVWIDDYVDVKTGTGPGTELRAGRVIKKHSAIDDYPYAYDLEFTISIDDENKKRHTSRIHNVATGLCVKRTPSYIERQSIEDQKLGKELEDLRRWKKEFSDEYFPIIEFMQENDKDLRIGNSIREKVLNILKNHFGKE
jgi:hypothetical protein